MDASDLVGKLEGTIMTLEFLGQSFPSKAIEENWKADMRFFAENFKPLDIKEIQTEELMLFEIKPNVWIRGYIDAIVKTTDDRVLVLDWKTSSMFTGDKLIEAGRQLLLYKKGLEIMQPGFKVDDVAWYMLKYSDVHYNNRSKVVRSGKWVQDRKQFIKRELDKVVSDGSADMMMEIALMTNSIAHLPQQVQDKFVIKPHVKYYDVTKENMKELDDYLLGTIDKIEESVKINEFPPVRINKGNQFFCQHICSHRSTCKYIKRHLDRVGN